MINHAHPYFGDLIVTYRVGGEWSPHHVYDLFLGLGFDVVRAGPGLSLWSGGAAAAGGGGLPQGPRGASGLQEGLVAVPQHLLLVLAVAVGLLEIGRAHV